MRANNYRLQQELEIGCQMNAAAAAAAIICFFSRYALFLLLHGEWIELRETMYIHQMLSRSCVTVSVDLDGTGERYESVRSALPMRRMKSRTRIVEERTTHSALSSTVYQELSSSDFSPLESFFSENFGEIMLHALFHHLFAVETCAPSSVLEVFGLERLDPRGFSDFDIFSCLNSVESTSFMKSSNHIGKETGCSSDSFSTSVKQFAVIPILT